MLDKMGTTRSSADPDALRRHRAVDQRGERFRQRRFKFWIDPAQKMRQLPPRVDADGVCIFPQTALALEGFLLVFYRNGPAGFRVAAYLPRLA